MDNLISDIQIYNFIGLADERIYVSKHDLFILFSL